MSSEQNQRTISSIKGTRDILPEEVRLWQMVEVTARQVLSFMASGS